MNNGHGGNIWKFNKRVIDFSANINPLGLSDKIKQTISKNLDLIAHYPEPYSQNITKDISNLLGIPGQNLLFGNGSIELIYLIPAVLKPRRVGIILPSFSEYEYASRNYNARCVFIKTYEEDNFKVSINNLIKYLPKIDVLFLAQPNNPTGALFSQEELLFLLNKTKQNKVFLVIDEVFIDFLKDKEDLSLIKKVAQAKNLIILRSLTKFFALAGLRLGYLVAYKTLIERIKRFQYPWAVNTLAQLVAVVVIKDKEYIKKSYQFILREKDFLFNELKRINSLKPFFPSANFILSKIQDNNYNSISLDRVLSKRGILIRDCSNFRGLNNKFFRIAVRKRKDNLRLVSTLREILE